MCQVGAHGTGADVPPVDEQVVSMKVKRVLTRTIMILLSCFVLT